MDIMFIVVVVVGVVLVEEAITKRNLYWQGYWMERRFLKDCGTLATGVQPVMSLKWMSGGMRREILRSSLSRTKMANMDSIPWDFLDSLMIYP